MTVGERIKEKRLEKGIAQIDLALKCGISKQTLYKYENNIVTNIPLNKITDLAVALNVTESYLMGWEDVEIVVEMANTDVALSNMSNRLKEYALRLATLNSEDQEMIMKMIDKCDSK